MSSEDRILIVDEQNRVTGEADRKEAHKRGLLHRVVRLFASDNEGRIFLQKRSVKLDDCPGRWDQSAAGHVDPGESNEQAVYREAMEEVGLRDVNFTEVGTYFSDNDVGAYGQAVKRFNTLYVCRANHSDISIDHDEVEDGRWFTKEEIEVLIKDHPETCTPGLILAYKFYSSLQIDQA